jgi:hypothetical protein
LSDAQGINIRPGFVQAIRGGRRTHIFLPGNYVPGQRVGLSKDTRDRMASRGGAPASYPTRWTGLQPGMRLFVQEEISALVDARHPELMQSFYKLDLAGGRVPIPGGVRGSKYRTTAWPANKCTREASRYTLEVTAVRRCYAQDVTWEEMQREGTFDPHATKGTWWGIQYGILMPWAENPEVVGMDFTFVDGNIDTGVRWVPEARPVNPNSARTAALMASWGTPGVKDD